ncbi:hypothetical protein MAUB1S_09683 [Mycolicibacterium aubagnense]
MRPSATIDRLEAALVKRMRALAIGHVECDAGTWRFIVRDNFGNLIGGINLSEFARDLERELS